MKYLLIAILAVGLYITWQEKEQIATKTTELKNQFKDLKNSIKQEIQSTKEKYKKILDENKQLKEELQKQKIDIEESKKIKLVVPKEDDYSKLIKKNDMMIDDLNLTQEQEQIKDDIKIHPEVFIDKENKTLEGVKVNIETKF